MTLGELEGWLREMHGELHVRWDGRVWDGGVWEAEITTRGQLAARVTHSTFAGAVSGLVETLTTSAKIATLVK